MRKALGRCCASVRSRPAGSVRLPNAWQKPPCSHREQRHAGLLISSELSRRGRFAGNGLVTNMTCREIIDVLIEYLSGELSAGERAEFERHLADCPDCTEYLRSYEETIKLGKGAFADPDAPMPLDVPEELVQAILVERIGIQ